MKYREVAPPPPLLSCVQSFWEIRGDRRLESPVVDRVLPDGCFDVVLHLGDLPMSDRVDSPPPAKRRMLLVGAALHAARITFSGDVHVVGACLRPGGVGTFLGVAACGLVDRTIALDEVWGSRAGTVEDRVATGDPDDALGRLADALATRRPSRAVPDPLPEEAVRRIRRAGGALSVQALADDLGVPTRRLERRFATHVGLTPKQFCRVTRFDGVVRERPDGRSWAERAAAHGYVDQAHLIHEFHALAGLAPLAFARERRESEPRRGVAD